MWKKTIIASLLLLAWISGSGQEDNDILYIFPSKEIYETGEDMWFKAIDGTGLLGYQTFTFRIIRNK